MAEQETGPIGRLIGSLSALLASLLAIGRTRLELFSVELQLELQRLAALALWALVALCASVIAAVLLGLSISIVFWDSHRILAALLVTGAFLLAAVLAVLVLRARIRSKPPILAGTLAELARDLERLGRKPS